MIDGKEYKTAICGGVGGGPTNGVFAYEAPHQSGGPNGVVTLTRNGNIEEIIFEDTVKVYTPNNSLGLTGLCLNLSKLKKVDLSGLDTSENQSASYMFHGCSELTEVDLSMLDFSKCTNRQSMFNGCTNLTKILVSHETWHEEIITNDINMFMNCPAGEVTYIEDQE